MISIFWSANPARVAQRWIAKDIRSSSGQSACAFNTIYCCCICQLLLVYTTMCQFKIHEQAQAKENWEHIIYWIPWVFIPCTVWYNRCVDIQNSHDNGCTLTPANRNDDLNFLHILRKHGHDRDYLLNWLTDYITRLKHGGIQKALLLGFYAPTILALFFSVIVIELLKSCVSKSISGLTTSWMCGWH